MLPKKTQRLMKKALKLIAEAGESLGDGTTTSLDPTYLEDDLYGMHALLKLVGKLACVCYVWHLW